MNHTLESRLLTKLADDDLLQLHSADNVWSDKTLIIVMSGITEVTDTRDMTDSQLSLLTRPPSVVSQT